MKSTIGQRSHKRKTSKILHDTQNGSWVSYSFFKQNMWTLIFILVAMLALMGLRYKTKTKMQQIKQLEAEYRRAESTMLSEKAAYMSLIREVEMKKLVEKNHLGLIFQEQPPYEVIKD